MSYAIALPTTGRDSTSSRFDPLLRRDLGGETTARTHRQQVDGRHTLAAGLARTANRVGFRGAHRFTPVAFLPPRKRQSRTGERDKRPRATSVDDAVTIRLETPAPLKKPFEIFGRRGSTNRPKTSLTTVSKTHRRQGPEIARKSGPS